ncbi:protein FAM76A isoform X2 [Hydra vulgaris]|uniref:Protein FAM76A isoform X2 n=1 Tax=Hydra vulgaris TaxID=6087 RepID=A0ABM4BLX0_HYDVU
MAGLFACTNCHSRHAFEDLSKEDQLCKACRKKFPIVQCSYCCLEFHIFKKLHEEPVCTKCSYNIEVYGEPKKCKYCQTKAAFKKSICSHCSSSEKKYGKPLKCHQCKLDCAFKKKSQEPETGKLLCFKCKIQHKRNLHMLEKQERSAKKIEKQVRSTKEKQEQNNYKKSLNGNDLSNESFGTLKAESLTIPLRKGIEIKSSSRDGTPLFDSNTDKEDMFTDSISNITALKEQIASLKKIITQKDKTILEKDIKISEFQAETWGKDKQMRQKIKNLEKTLNEQIENLKTENQLLKKQISSSVKKTPKVSHVASRIQIESYKISNAPSSERKSIAPNIEETIYSEDVSEDVKLAAQENDVKMNIKETYIKRHHENDSNEDDFEHHSVKRKKCKVISDDEDNSENNSREEETVSQDFFDNKEIKSEVVNEPHSSDDEGTFQGFSDGEN